MIPQSVLVIMKQLHISPMCVRTVYWEILFGGSFCEIAHLYLSWKF